MKNFYAKKLEGFIQKEFNGDAKSLGVFLSNYLNLVFTEHLNEETDLSDFKQKSSRIRRLAESFLTVNQ